MLIKTVDIVIIVLDMNSSVIIDWLKTFNFDEISMSFFTIKSHNSALIKLYLIDILHNK